MTGPQDSVPAGAKVNRAGHINISQKLFDELGEAASKILGVVGEVERNAGPNEPDPIILSTPIGEFEAFTSGKAGAGNGVDRSNENVAGVEDDLRVVNDRGHKNSPSVGAPSGAGVGNHKPTDGEKGRGVPPRSARLDVYQGSDEDTGESFIHIEGLTDCDGNWVDSITLTLGQTSNLRNALWIAAVNLI